VQDVVEDRMPRTFVVSKAISRAYQEVLKTNGVSGEIPTINQPALQLASLHLPMSITKI
jgi:hypothetical protein